MSRIRDLAPVATAILAVLLVGGALWHGEVMLGIGVAALGLLALRTARLRPLGGAEPPHPGDAPRQDPSWIVAAHPDPVLAVDAREVVTVANGAARAVIPGLKVGQPLAFAVRAPEVLDAIRHTVAERVPTSVEFGGRSATDPVWEVRLRPLAPGALGDSTAILFFRDRSGERRLEAMRSDFVATVSHELRTPLASLAGFIDTLRGPARNDTAAQERFLGIMRSQADRMSRLVDDLLQLSRVELNAHVAPVTPIDLGPVVGHMVEIMAPLARERGVRIEVSGTDGPAVLRGDRDELLRVVENLVENAIKYGGDGGRVEVSLAATQDKRGLELVVQDHGPGIPAEHLPRLTERFYRVDAVESRSQGGTGLGLAIVKHIVGRHRGRLSIESDIGSGTRVTVWLPASPPSG